MSSATQIDLSTDRSTLGEVLTSFEQSLGTAGAVLGYQLADQQGTVIGGGTGDFQADRRAITESDDDWFANLAAQGQTFAQVSAKVMRLSDSLQSDWLSLEDAKAFVGAA